ncbi:MAG: DUF2236 domain-containing protein [Chloroflexi bacterium]|nr:DUF2236 domain-containing protein [Chloroflexota bacterium]OJV92985.1 MAG: hypothetical protein BGO39_20935 [Chloroflexi bacterium 54-19]
MRHTKHKALQEVLTLDPRKDYERIVYLLACYEFPFDVARSGEMALFRTFAVPGIANLLHHTGEFTHRTQKRYDDTDLILSTIFENGFDTKAGRTAFSRMNKMHGHYIIPNHEMLYVLSTFIYVPIRWMERFGWRPLTEQEKLGLFYYMREAGRRMNIKELPNDYHEFEQFSLDYERDNFAYSGAAHKIADLNIDMFLGWFLPKFLRPLGRPFIYALLDEPMLKSFGFPRPPKIIVDLVTVALKLRAKLVSFLPERKKPLLRSKGSKRSYPLGHKLDEVGTKLS